MTAQTRAASEPQSPARYDRQIPTWQTGLDGVHGSGELTFVYVKVL